MPQSSSQSSDSSGKGYNLTSHGNNSQGNHYCSRDYTPSHGENHANSYHYSNTNGSYYYANPNGSSYYDNGKGGSSYTAPGGK